MIVYKIPVVLKPAPLVLILVLSLCATRLAMSRVLSRTERMDSNIRENFRRISPVEARSRAWFANTCRICHGRLTINSLSLRASIIKWAPTHSNPKVISQPNCDTKSRFSCDCTFWNGIACSNARNDTQFSCNEPWESQSPNGMIWRSPWEAAIQNQLIQIFSLATKL